MAANYEEAIRDALKPMADELREHRQTLAALKRPASKSGLSMQDVAAWMQANNKNVAVGNDGAGYFAPTGWRPQSLTKGCGMGAALRAIADIESRGSFGGVSSREQLEKEWGFTTLERYKEYGVRDDTGYIRKAALAEGSGVTGGYVVPPQFAARLLQLAIEESFIRQRASVFPMTARTLTIPSLDQTTAQAAGVTAFLGGIYASWQPEAATINETEPTFRQTELTAWDLVAYTVASNQLLADNAVALDALLTQLFPLAIAWYTEYAFLRGLGAGSSMPLGVLNANATISVQRTTASKFFFADAVNMMSKLYVRSWDAATTTWVIHQTVFPQLAQMMDVSSAPAAGMNFAWLNPVTQAAGGPASQAPPMSLLGIPIVITEKVPPLGTPGDVMLVDWAHYVIGDRMDLQIDVSPHVKFLNNQMVWRLVARLDGKPWLNNKVTLADGPHQVSPYVILGAA